MSQFDKLWVVLLIVIQSLSKDTSNNKELSRILQMISLIIQVYHNKNYVETLAVIKNSL